MKEICALAAVLVLGGAAMAQTRPNAADRLATAARVMREARPRIPAELFNRARCVAVIPGLTKPGFVSGREEGRGVLSCRAGEGWSAPVFLRLAKGSWAVSAGAGELDVVLLVMNENGAQKLLRSDLALGVDVSIAEGQVEEEAAPGAPATLTEILAYSRADSLVTGVNLSGATVRPDADANRDVYGPGGTPSVILASRSISAPTEATPFFQALGGAGPSLGAAKPAADGPLPAQAARPPGPDLRTQLIAIEQAIDRLLANSKSSPVGTSGRIERGQEVSVPRERLELLRSQIEAAIAALDTR
ncbi:MAG TPA: lipid-binding SYLF domain-containing protein [Vicinamibacterales bacterium]|nr:lipid-binding SYLF domain-containing protein [Vicinamibacterales bacterium]